MASNFELGPLIVCGLALLVVLTSMADIVLASWALHYFNTLRDQRSVVLQGNVAYNTDITDGYLPWQPPDSTGSGDGTLPNHSNILFLQDWILSGTTSLAEVTPRVELAAGVVALVLGLMLCTWVVVRVRTSPASTTAINTVTGVLAIPFALVITALFGYVYAAWSNGSQGSNLIFSGLLGSLGWDAWPTWEVWTCAIADLIDHHPEVSAAGPEWRKVCTLTTAARWTLLPVFVFAILGVVVFLSIWAHAAWMATFGSQVESEELEAFGGTRDPEGYGHK